MDFRSPPEVIDALQERIAHGIFGYPSPSAAEKAIQAFCVWTAKRFGWEVMNEEVLYSPGLISTLSVLVSLLSSPGEQVIIQSPAYQPFFRVIEHNQRICSGNPLIYDEKRHEYLLDFDDLEKRARQSDTTLMIFCSPHNPAGRVWTRDEIEHVYDICERNGVSVISDEIHADLCYSDYTHTPFPSVQNAESSIDVITCMAPSKTFNIAGEHFSCAVIPKEQTRERFKKELSRLSISSPGVLALTAARTAYEQGMPWLEELLDVLQTHAELIDTYFQEHIPLLHLVRPQASFIAFIDCRTLQKELKRRGFSGSCASFFAKSAGIALHDGRWFGHRGDGFVRINFGAPRQLIISALDAMKKAVDDLLI
jgi:cystathionine beta-lyase